MKNEPDKLTNTLMIIMGELEQVATRLYELEEENDGSAVEDAMALLDSVRKSCKEKRL